MLSFDEGPREPAMFSGIVALIMLLTTISNSTYTIIAPFLPLELVRKEVSETLSGYIFAIYSLSIIFGSPLMCSVIQKVGRRTTITLGSALMGVTFIVFGLIGHIESTVAYVTFALAARLLQGLATVSIQVTCYSIATNFFPVKKMRLIGLIEAATGLGMIAGPFIGTVLFQIAGYNGMLFCFGAIFLVITGLMPFVLPVFVDKKT